MDWKVKVAKQAVINRLPFADALRTLKRRQFGYEPNPFNLESTLEFFAEMQGILKGYGRSFEGASVLEIGSGWFPTIPIMLAVSGAKKIWMTDLNPHMDSVTFASTLGFLRNKFPTNERLRAIKSIEDLPIQYLAPFSASDVPAREVDFVISRTVLEHIPPPVIVDLLRSLKPALSENALMLHLVDHSDHLEHTDKNLSKINFLCWSERKHSLVNRLIGDGENRLRDHEYLPLFQSAGYRVVSSTSQVHQATRDRVATLPLVEPYTHMTPDQLATLSSSYVLASAD